MAVDTTAAQAAADATMQAMVDLQKKSTELQATSASYQSTTSANAACTEAIKDSGRRMEQSAKAS